MTMRRARAFLKLLDATLLVALDPFVGGGTTDPIGCCNILVGCAAQILGCRYFEPAGGAPNMTAGTPSGLMLAWRRTSGVSPGFPHW